MTIKVLPLDFWMADEDLFDSSDHPSAPVIFNRNGIYRTPFLCWFEVNGKAYQYSRKDFDYTLSLMTASELNDRQAAALSAVVSHGLATPVQSNLLHLHKENKLLQQIRRETNRFLKRPRIIYRKQPCTH